MRWMLVALVAWPLLVGIGTLGRADEGQAPAHVPDLVGLVQDDQGRPLADVEVVVEIVPPHVPPLVHDPSALLDAPVPREIAGRTRTDEGGRFRLPVATTSYLLARVRGPAWVGQAGRLQDDASEVVVKVRRARRLDVEVRGARDEPLQAVFSSWSLDPTCGPHPSYNMVTPELTDEQGRLAIYLVPTERATVSILVPHVVQARKELLLPPEGTPLVVRPLAGAGRVRVRVVEPGGAVVPGARVVATLTPWPPDRETGSIDAWLDDGGLTRMARSDEQGWATLDGLPRGVLSGLQAFAEGHPPAILRAGAPVLDAEPFEIELALPEGHEIAGHVVTPEGRAVPGVLVCITQGTVLRAVTTDETGAFRTKALAAGGYRLDVRHPDAFAVLGAAVRPDPLGAEGDPLRHPAPPLFHVELPAPGAESLQITLKPAASLRVHVTDPDGEPVPIQTATLSGRPERPQESLALFGAGPSDGVGWSDATRTPGLVVFNGLPTGWTFQGHLGVEGHAGAAIPTVQIAYGTTSLDVRLTVERLRAITGRVVDGKGRALARMAVSTDRGQTATSDEQGRFRIDGVPPLVREVFLMGDVDREHAVRVDLAREGAVEVELVLGEPLHPLVVTALHADGKPVRGLEIRWFVQGRKGSSWDTHTTDERGRVTFSHVPTRVDTLMVGGAQHPLPGDPRPTELQIPVSVVEQALQLTRAVRPQQGLVCYGRVRLPDGRPLPRGWVEVATPRLRAERAPVLSGRFALWAWGGVPLGDAHVRVVDPREIDGRPLNLVNEDHAVHMDRAWRPVELEMRAGRIVRGIVKDEEGRGVPGVQLHVRPVDEAPHVETTRSPSLRSSRALFWIPAVTSDGQGRFELAGLRPEWEYDLLVRTPPAFAHVPVQRLAACATDAEPQPSADEVQVTVRRWKPLRGRVLDDAGSPVVHATVSLSAPAGVPHHPHPGQSTQMTAEDGTFRFAAVAPDRPLRVTVHELRHAEGGTFQLVHDVEQVPDEPLELVVERHASLHVRLVDAGGTPVRSAQATLASWYLDSPRASDLRAGSDDEGRLVFSPLRRGSYRLSIHPGGRAWWSAAPEPTSLRVDVPREAFDVIVDLPPPDVLRVEAAPGAGAIQSAIFHAGDVRAPGVPATQQLRTTGDRLSARATVGRQDGALLVQFATGKVALLPYVRAREEPWIAVPEDAHRVEVELSGVDRELLGIVQASLRVELVRGSFVLPVAWDAKRSRVPDLPAGTYEVRLVGELHRMRGSWDVAPQITLPSDPIVVRYLPP